MNESQNPESDSRANRSAQVEIQRGTKKLLERSSTFYVQLFDETFMLTDSAHSAEHTPNIFPLARRALSVARVSIIHFHRALFTFVRSLRRRCSHCIRAWLDFMLTLYAAACAIDCLL